MFTCLGSRCKQTINVFVYIVYVFKSFNIVRIVNTSIETRRTPKETQLKETQKTNTSINQEDNEEDEEEVTSDSGSSGSAETHQKSARIQRKMLPKIKVKW